MSLGEVSSKAQAHARGGYRLKRAHVTNPSALRATKGFAPDGSETIQDELVGTGANGDLRSSTALVWHALLSVGFSCRRPPLGVEDGVVVVLRPPPLP